MTRTRTRRRMPSAERREQLVRVAREVFAEDGYEDAVVEVIAARAGVTKPVVYQHFEGKRDLYLAVLEEHLADLIGRLWVALSASPDPRARLRAGLRAYFEFVEEREDGFRMLVEAGVRNDPQTQATLGSTWDTLADGIARIAGDLLRAAGLDPAGAPVYARALIGMTQSVADWWVRTKRLSREEAIDYLLALTWRGFDGLPRHPTHHHLDRGAAAAEGPSASSVRRRPESS